MKKLLFLCFLSLGSMNILFAGGWLQGKSKGYFKLNQSVLIGDRFFSRDRSESDIITSGVYMTSLYGEYGISEKIDLLAYVPFFTRITINDVRFSDGGFQEGDNFNSFGDVDLGIKYGIIQGESFVMSASLLFGIPFGVTDGGNSQLLQSGDGEFNQLVRLDFGYGLSSPLYANASIGFNNRTEGFSEEFRYEFELGYTVAEKWLLAFKLSGIESFNNGNSANIAQTGIFSNNLEFLTLGPEVSYKFSENWGISGSYRGLASGQLIIAAPSYGLGIFFDLK